MTMSERPERERERERDEAGGNGAWTGSTSSGPSARPPAAPADSAASASAAEAASSAGSADPRVEYVRRLEDRRARRKSREAAEEWIANARLAMFGVGVLVAVLVFGGPGWHWGWLVAAIAGFGGLVVWSERVARAAARAERGVAYYERGLARLDDRWAGAGDSDGARFLDPEHPYAADLDLFGPGSVYELLCAARTRAGEEILAAWLLAPAPPNEIRARQKAVAELAPMLDFREDLALRGADVRAGIDADSLDDWGRGPSVFREGRIAWLAALASAVSIACLVLWLVGRWPATPFLASTLALIALHWAARSRVARVVASVEKHAHDLELLAELLGQLERREFRSEKLRALRLELEIEGHPPSERIARLGRLVSLHQAMRNQFFAPFGLLLLWPLHMAIRIDRWRAESGAGIARWLRAIGELETLASFAGFAHENPENPFPEIVEPGNAAPTPTPTEAGADSGALLEADDLGHPLIPRDRVVRNDVALGRSHPRVLVVSGSNMSGKSTLLRAVGVNAALALAGAPVRARRLRLTPVALGGTLRVQDSLQAGKSRFYAEIKRVRQLVDISRGEIPLLFLLDEIFSGTNSHERCQGAEAVVRGLLRVGAIGLMTTHDLTLARLGDELGDAARNVHFEDRFDEGELKFDYRMRPGVVSKSNAIALMRAVGLEV